MGKGSNCMDLFFDYDPVEVDNSGQTFQRIPFNIWISFSS